MGTTTETRITSTQAKDAIYKAHSINSNILGYGIRNSFSLLKDGDILNQKTLSNDNTFDNNINYTLFDNLDTSLISNFVIKGKDSVGNMYGSNLDGTIYSKTNDGVIFETFIPSTGFVNIFFDSQNNKYASNGTKIYRAVANSWTFEQIITLEHDGANVTTWNFSEDGVGNIIFSEYGVNDASNTAIYVSHNYGNSFVKKNPFEFGQKHYHNTAYHKKSGKLYMIVGEGGTWNGITLSADKGETFTQLHSGYRPTSSVEYGDYMIFGQDQSPTSVIFLNTTTDTIEVVDFYSGIGISPNTIGYIFSMVIDVENNILYIPTESESSNIFYSGIVAMDLTTRIPYLLEAYPNSRKRLNKWLFGFDTKKNLYLANGNGSTTLIKQLKKNTLVPLKTAISGTLINNFSFPIENIIQVDGYDVFELKKTATSYQVAPKFAVVEGDVLNLAFLFKYGGGGIPAFRIQKFTDETTTNTSTYMNAGETYNAINFTVSHLTYKVPAGVKYIQIQLQQGGDNLIDLNYISSNILVTKGKVGYMPFAKNSFYRKYTAQINIDTAAFKNKMLIETSSEYINTDSELELMSFSNITIGIKKNGTDSLLYVKQDGITIGSVYASCFGGSFDFNKPCSAIISNSLRISKIIPKTIDIAITKTNIYVKNNETSIAVIIPITEIENAPTFTLSGNCYHFPYSENINYDKFLV